MFFLVHIPALIRIMMASNSSRTARILSVVVLILSLAPLGSMYACFYYSYYVVGGPTIVNSNNVIPTSNNDHDEIIMTHRNNHNNNNNNENIHKLAQVLINPNATLEDLWKALFFTNNNNHNYNNPDHYFAKDPLASLVAGTYVPFLLPNSNIFAQHISILIPWILSLVLGVIVPCGLSIYSFVQQSRYARRRRRRQRRRRGRRGDGDDDDDDDYDDDDSEEDETRREKRLQRLLLRLRYYTKTLEISDIEQSECVGEEEEEDNNDNNNNNNYTQTDDNDASNELSMDDSFLSDTDKLLDDEDEDDEEDEIPKSWMIPRPGVSLEQVQQHMTNDDPFSNHDDYYRTVSSSCAICLNPLKEKESICWSPNSECIHVFHETCIVSWLMLRRKHRISSSGNNSKCCPCCRQPFILQLSLSTSTSSRLQTYNTQ